MQSEGVSFRERRRNKNSLAHTRDQNIVEDAKTVLPAGKAMTTVFWVSQGEIHIDYIYIDYQYKGTMDTELYYTELLGLFDA